MPILHGARMPEAGFRRARRVGRMRMGRGRGTLPLIVSRRCAIILHTRSQLMFVFSPSYIFFMLSSYNVKIERMERTEVDRKTMACTVDGVGGYGYSTFAFHEL